ncbi:MAG: UvrD-helicase domain-containing protein [Flavobacteriales bacterium]|nr:UvrD-helicase domain-containing protein [Flavobacteriales bacterium]
MFTLLHSGAGAGKTHALVKHYLRHCLSGDDPAAYRHVLALTFTNKAAAEMRARVLRYLKALAAQDTGNKQLEDVMTSLTHAAKCDAVTLARRAEATLGHMLHHWGDVSISTIDAFTRRVVKPFARDLRLDHDLRMTTETDHYLGHAVEQLVAQAGVEPNLTGLLSDACLQLLDDEKGWDPEPPLRELGKQLFREDAIRPLAELGAMDAEAVQRLARRLREQVAGFRKQVQAVGREALELLQKAGVTAEDMAHGTNGIHGWFRKLNLLDVKWDEPGRNTLKPLETGVWHSAKAQPAAKRALETLSGDLTELFHRALELRDAGYRTFLLRDAVARELVTAYALCALGEQLEKAKLEEGVTFFSDLTRKVAEVVRGEPAPFIHERLGARYRHYLIDEFQDTSLLQWGSLLPLIHEALSTGGSALLVGDAKQAIYRWRNGEVRLFRDLPRVFGRDPADEAEAEREATLKRYYQPTPPLDHNYRSASTIVHFNNTLFARLQEGLPEELRAIYADHGQRVVQQREGYVRLERLPADATGDGRERAMLDHMLRQVQMALDDGFAPGDIAVLVRTGSQGRSVAKHMVAQGHAVISPDGLRLGGDPVINLIIDLLRFLHAGEQALAARVIQGQARLLAASDDLFVEPFAGDAGQKDPAARLRRWLISHGSPRLRTTLTALIAQLARAHGISPATDAQMLTLLDEAHQYATRHGQDIGGFLDHWERAGGQRSVAVPAHGRAVQVMTVHKSKGLEFPVVILADSTMGSSPRQAERLWVRPGVSIPELPVALVRDTKPLSEAGLPEIEEEHAMRGLDALNLLYVACTRAVQRLHLLVPERGADVLNKGVLAHMDEHGRDGVLEIGQRMPPWEEDDGTQADMLQDAGGLDGMPSLAIRFEAPEEWDPQDPLAADAQRRHGEVVHAILARIITADDVEAALAQAVGRGELAPSEPDALASQLKEILAAPAMLNWFGAGLQVRNEATLITAEGKALRPDRVVREGDRLRVLDIKTGRRSDRHHEQVREYMRHLGAMGHAGVEGALLYITERELVPVSP